MLVREVMTAPVVTVHPAVTVRQAVLTMVEQDVSAMPVVDADGDMVGLVTEADLLRGEFDADPRAFARPVTPETVPPPATVEQVMTRSVLTAGETTDVAAVAELMFAHRIKNVPVVRNQRLTGMVNRRDLLRVLTHTDSQIHEDVVAAIRKLVPDADVSVVHVRNGLVTIEAPADALTAQVASLIAQTVSGVSRVSVVDHFPLHHPA